MKILRFLFNGVALCSLLGACAPLEKDNVSGETVQPQPQPQPQPDKDVIAFVTKADRSQTFARSTFDFKKGQSISPSQIHYDKNTDLGVVDGFGTAITQASGYNLLKMSPEDRHQILLETFGKDYAASSLIRVCIGGSDFCVNEEFTWCDEPGMENFKIHPQDAKYVIPVLKEIYEINPDVMIIATPWTCPRWMKGTEKDPRKPYDSWKGGRLNPEHYGDYAEYFVRWIQTMEDFGFNIYAVTMQNEPLHKGNNMSLYMPWEDQAAFVKVLGPALQKAGIGTKILAYDHNYDNTDYAINVFKDPEASRWVAGSAWHNYAGNVSNLDKVVEAAPDKDHWFTEASIGTWCYDKNGVFGGNFPAVFMNDFRHIIWGNIRRGGRGVTFWNFMLDDKRGPTTSSPDGCKNCYGAVTINSKDYKTVTKNSQWYNMAMPSSVIRPGAKRIEATGVEQNNNFIYAMYLNPNNTIGVIIFNDTDEDRPLVFANPDFYVRYTVPAKSQASLKWQE